MQHHYTFSLNKSSRSHISYYTYSRGIALKPGIIMISITHNHIVGSCCHPILAVARLERGSGCVDACWQWFSRLIVGGLPVRWVDEEWAGHGRLFVPLRLGMAPGTQQWVIFTTHTHTPCWSEGHNTFSTIWPLGLGCRSRKLLNIWRRNTYQTGIVFNLYNQDNVIHIFPWQAMPLSNRGTIHYPSCI